jgi:cell division protein ZapA (FtsZ GTPase activity inhibitor)
VNAVDTPTRTASTPVAIEIGGQRIRLNAASDGTHIVELARQVQERFQTVQRETRNNIPSTVLALVALHLADELADAKQQLEAVREEAKRTVAAAESRAREVEQLARRAVVEAIAEIDRTLALDDELGRRHDRAEGSESA